MGLCASVLCDCVVSIMIAPAGDDKLLLDGSGVPLFRLQFGQSRWVWVPRIMMPV